MIKNYFLLKEISKYLNSTLTGCTLEEAYTQEKNKLVLIFQNEWQNIYSLEFYTAGGKEYLFTRGEAGRARKNTVNLFEELYGQKVILSRLFNDDRVISVEFDNNYELLFSFITGKINAFVTRSSIIINSFTNTAEYINKDINGILTKPVKANTEAHMIKELINDSYRHFGNDYIREALHRSGIAPEENITDESKDKLAKAFSDIAGELKNPVFRSYNNSIISLVSLSHLKSAEYKEYKDVNELVRDFSINKLRNEKSASIKESKIKELEKKIAQINKKISSLNLQLKQCSESDKLKRTGEMILANLHLIEKGSEKFKAEDLSTGEVYEIKLKRDISPAENAQKYFEKYKNQKASVGILETRIKGLQREKASLVNELDKVKNLESIKQIVKMEKEEVKGKGNDETSKFRKFVLNEKYEVWVGKDSVSNDLLTTKYSAPNDLWFHVRGASGSHTVLKISNKKAEPGKEIITKAASIAAYYSKARNASNVPVAYCEKKYVKKKKGFKSGSVVMEREKIVFVKPQLPEEKI
jgi:predicted ribosome quality control (RQC) complex YloA/Tae2 family protein